MPGALYGFQLESASNREHIKPASISQHISSIFQKNIARKDIDRIIDMLFANKMISEANNAISYGFWDAQPCGQPDAVR